MDLHRVNVSFFPGHCLSILNHGVASSAPLFWPWVWLKPSSFPRSPDGVVTEVAASGMCSSKPSFRDQASTRLSIVISMPVLPIETVNWSDVFAHDTFMLSCAILVAGFTPLMIPQWRLTINIAIPEEDLHARGIQQIHHTACAERDPIGSRLSFSRSFAQRLALRWDHGGGYLMLPLYIHGSPHCRAVVSVRQ